MSLSQPALRRERVCVAGGTAEPTIPADLLVNAIEPGEVEIFRPLLPVGYGTGVDAYQAAVGDMTTRDLTSHYTSGLEFFHDEFAPQLKQRIEALTGNAWSLCDYVAYAAGSDVDFMTHVVEAVAARERVCLYPGDWFGFQVGCTESNRIVWDAEEGGALACLCIPSVRNGHVTEPMLQFLAQSDACLLNLNLFPTLKPQDRHDVARSLLPVLPQSILSISFSRGFGLTASTATPRSCCAIAAIAHV